MDNTAALQCLLSLPAASARFYGALRPSEEMVCACDPPGGKLGSGGGLAQMLAEGWRAGGNGHAFDSWLGGSRKLVVLGGGQSRRLPAYAAVGKPFIPLPVLQGSFGQRLDQTLLDLQLASWGELLGEAPVGLRVMVASGDVLLRFTPGALAVADPAADVVLLGMRVDEQTASHFGVFFSERTAPGRLAFCLQKPSAGRIRELTTDYDFLVDTGLWLLSARAVGLLLGRCGWDAARGDFTGDRPARYELYSEFGLALGARPTRPDPELGGLCCQVLALGQPEFYHLGTSRQLIDSVCELQNLDARSAVHGATRIYPEQVIQNALFEPPPRRSGKDGPLWIENACVPASWRLAGGHVLTGVPDNTWPLALEPGVCLDFIPVGERALCVRPYGLDDTFAGSAAVAPWLGRPAGQWLAARGLDWEAAGIDPEADIYQAPLFPCLEAEAIEPEFLTWLFAERPAASEEMGRRWLGLERLSAEQVNARVNLERLEAQRAANRYRALRRMYQNRRASVFYRLDLAQTARLYAAGDDPLPPPPDGVHADPLAQLHDSMWRAAVLRRRGQAEAAAEEGAMAASALRRALLEPLRAAPARPACQVLADQIVWGRAPARLDLAGGWTDTPPYCLQHGGRVVNVAVNLNGQPPIQVFARLGTQRRLVIRSIDQGVEEHIETYEQLAAYDRPGSAFALARAALVLAGFLPRFYDMAGPPTLERLLEDFGGGIELTLLAAIPQGSGLGTSSILAATLLGTLSELCGLHWDHQELLRRTLGLEQMLTTGGGWQDQVGGVLPGIKLGRSEPGLGQQITVRWLPDHLLSEPYVSGRMLLYYTGLTRLAKNILQEIVGGMFLNEAGRLGLLRSIGENAEATADAIQRLDWEGLVAGVARSWDLNQRLDAGTNPPAIQALLAPIQADLAALKLLGAGGGGYMLMLARDEAAARRIRRRLESEPPNAQARFVEMSVSRLGLEITRS